MNSKQISVYNNLVTGQAYYICRVFNKALINNAIFSGKMNSPSVETIHRTFHQNLQL